MGIETLEQLAEWIHGQAKLGRRIIAVDPITAASHDPKGSRVSTPCGTVDLKHNRTVGIEKARSGRGTGCRLAFEFELGSLKLKELGLITKELR